MPGTAPLLIAVKALLALGYLYAACLPGLQAQRAEPMACWPSA